MHSGYEIKLQAQRDKTPAPNQCSGYDIKQSDGEALALEI